MTISEAKDEERISPIRAVERVCDIFDLLQEAPSGMSLTDIADRTKLPKSTAYRYLVALEARRYIERDDETNIARLGLAFRPRPTRRIEQFLNLAQSVMESTRDRTNETVNIGMLEGGQYSHVAVVESEQIMRLAARVGERGMIHATAIGKVIAAQLAPGRVRSILLSEGMPRLSQRTITDVDTYMREVETVRRRGFAVDDCESQEDGRCIAVPVEGLDLPTGLSISAPARRLPKRQIPELANLLRSDAERLSDLYRSISD